MFYSQRELNILIIDDHKVLIEGICAILSKKIDPKPRMFEATTINKAWEVIAHNRSTLDLILVDLDIPNGDGKRLAGLDLAIEIQEEYPDLKQIIISNEKAGEIILKSYQNKIKGYIGKSETTGGDILAQAIEEVVIHNNTFYRGDIRRKMDEANFRQRPTFEKLLPREKEVVILMANGYKTGDIAKKLKISEATIERAKNEAMRKLGAKNGPELVAKAFSLGIISKDDMDGNDLPLCGDG